MTNGERGDRGRLVRGAIGALIVLAASANSGAHGQSIDFGKVFEKAARKVARDAIVGPGGIVEGVAPDATGARSKPVPVQTADGWTLVAHHYPPAGGQVRPGTMPVILCHGLTYNATFWDLDPNASLARYLADRGFDVWVTDLRGSGMSQKWVWKLEEAPEMLIGGAVRRLSMGRLAPTGYATADPKAANWTLDHHIAYDVPALVSLVRRETGAPEVAWIGHSMGGIVAICHLEAYQNPGIGRLITVGSQVTMPNGQLALQFLREMLETRGEMLLGQIKGEEILTATRTSVHNMFFNQRNVAPEISEALGTWAVDVPSVGVLQQYMVMARTGELLDARKGYNYARNLGNITVPILITCGADDQFAPPGVQRYIHDRVGSEDKTLLTFGVQDGYAADAGHNDALVGLNSQAQTYPILERWLLGARRR